MHVIEQAITGARYQALAGGTPEAALEQFYAAFNGRERGHFRKGDTELALAIRTSRVFRKIGGCRKQVHHHGSIDDPGLLARYQSAVLGGVS